MGDRYLGFANSTIGRLIVSTFGLPRPPLLRRESDDSPHSLSGYVHVGVLAQVHCMPHRLGNH